MTLVEQKPETEKNRPPTTEELLARLPEIPHVGSYNQLGGKDRIFIPPFIPGNEVDPTELKKKKK
jgi:hypothetical protein